MKPGDEVVCIKKGNWVDGMGNIRDANLSPKFNEIVTIINVYTGITFSGRPLCVELKEYPPNTHRMGFRASWFVHLVPDSVLEDELASVENISV